MMATAPAILGFDRSHWDALVRSVGGVMQGRVAQADVEDAVSYALLRACEHPPSHGHLITWLHHVACNALRDVLKSTRYRAQQPIMVHDWVSAESADAALLAEEAATERRDRLAHVAALLDTLPSEEAQALVLMAAGVSSHEIAARQACSVGAVRTRVWRARRALRQHFTEAKAA